MKLREFIENLNKLAKGDESLLDLDVVFADSDRGDWFQILDIEPSLGIFEDPGVFHHDDTGTDKVTAICIN